MPTSVENICCRQSSCITSTDLFESTVLDINVLSIAIVNRSDTFVEPVDYSLSSYRKAAYRRFILWKEGHLGRGNRKVLPSCVVWSVRNRYPAPDGKGSRNITIILCNSFVSVSAIVSYYVSSVLL